VDWLDVDDLISDLYAGKPSTAASIALIIEASPPAGTSEAVGPLGCQRVTLLPRVMG